MKKRSSTGLMTTQTLLDFDLEESSSDSDFRIEDHDDDSDDFSANSNDERSDGGDSDGDSDDDDDDDSDTDFAAFKKGFDPDSKAKDESNLTTAQILAKAKAKEALDKANAKMLATPICCACLGDRSDDTNEIVECDNCGISVHEGCYGISDSVSVSSTVSSCSTEPWFCEACKANKVDPVCELCPNKGGIFKETDVGKWVHLVCALYVPGVAFGEVDHLSSVTLFEMPYSKWGAKTCSLCEDPRYSRCGVCIGCDAGMCKTYFHVTCAQAAGLLAETHSEEADHADPFYAHCKIHSDKTLIKHRKRNFNALKMKMDYRNANVEQKRLEQSTSTEQLRIERKLKKHRNKYVTNKTVKSEPWVPTQKMPRLLNTSASACRRLIMKAELMGIDTAALEFQEAQMAALSDVRKKWHIPPSFGVEFIGYYLDRISRSKEMKVNLQQQLELNKNLLSEQQVLRDKYDEAIRIHTEHTTQKSTLTDAVEKLHMTIRALCPNKQLPSVKNIGQPVALASPPQVLPPVTRPMVPTAAALKMGVGFPLVNLPGTVDDTNRILSTQCQSNSDLLHECGICKRCNDQHLLAKCDTCHLHYHLGCLNPPLSRHPKKSKIYGWQCSECDEDNPDGVPPLTSGPRKSRTKYSKDGTIVPVDSSFDISSEDNRDDEKPVIPHTAICDTSDTPKMSDSKLSDSFTEPEVLVEKPSPEKPSTEAHNIPATVPEVVIKNSSKKRKKSDFSRGIEKAEVLPVLKIEEPSPVDTAKADTSLDITKVPEAKVVENPPVAVNSSIPPIEEIVKKEKSMVESHPGDSEGSPKKMKANKKLKKDKNKAKNRDKDREKSKERKKAKSIEKAAAKEIAASNGTVDALGTAVMKSEPMAMSPESGAPSSSTHPSVTHTERKHKSKSDSSMVQGESTKDHNQTELTHKQSRKRRKEKHRNKHGSDGERSPSKEHKKKRKRKNHDHENPNTAMTSSNDGIPRIKIKFKALPLPGETAAEPQCFYVPADMVRPRESPIRSRPASVDSTEELTSTPVLETASPTPSSQSQQPETPQSPVTTKPLPLIRTRRISVLLSPPKAFHSSKRTATPANVSTNSVANTSITALICDVCQVGGSAQDLVQCDECKKNYHFQCLEPPLKKTPKKRGYSWHCADCDPTDKEDN